MGTKVIPTYPPLKFLSLYSDIENATQLYELIDSAIRNAKKAKKALSGSSLIVLPINAIKADRKAKEIIKRFEQNTRNMIRLENEVRKVMNSSRFGSNYNRVELVR